MLPGAPVSALMVDNSERAIAVFGPRERFDWRGSRCRNGPGVLQCAKQASFRMRLSFDPAVSKRLRVARHRQVTHWSARCRNSSTFGPLVHDPWGCGDALAGDLPVGRTVFLSVLGSRDGRDAVQDFNLTVQNSTAPVWMGRAQKPVSLDWQPGDSLHSPNPNQEGKRRTKCHLRESSDPQ